MEINDLKQTFGSLTKTLEIIYLLEDIKPCVRQGFYDEELKKVIEFCKKNNLFYELSPYKIVLETTKDEYSDKGVKVDMNDSRRGLIFIYISKDKKAEKANYYEIKQDHKNLGLTLGYPECCCDFFVKFEPEESKKKNDYIMPVLNNSKEPFPFYTNFLAKYSDITLLNHFPCSFNCEKSIELAKQHLKVIEKHDKKLAEKFKEILKSDVGYSEEGIEIVKDGKVILKTKDIENKQFIGFS